MITENAKKYEEKMGIQEPIEESDPEFIERFYNFAYDEVVNEKGQELPEETRFMCILAVLLGCQGIDLFEEMVEASLNMGVSEIKIREIVYQGVDYLGYGRVKPFIPCMNEVFKKKGIELPLPPQATNTMETRYETGEQKQIDLFGPHMKGFGQSGPEESRHINQFLVKNCFGDYYTRNGLNDVERELMTFCYLYAQGGCEPQLKSHTMANLGLGNDKAFLIKVISTCIPFIGYPRTLNALRIINEAYEETQKK